MRRRHAPGPRAGSEPRRANPKPPSAISCRPLARGAPSGPGGCSRAPSARGRRRARASFPPARSGDRPSSPGWRTWFPRTLPGPAALDLLVFHPQYLVDGLARVALKTEPESVTSARGSRSARRRGRGRRGTRRGPASGRGRSRVSLWSGCPGRRSRIPGRPGKASGCLRSVYQRSSTRGASPRRRASASARRPRRPGLLEAVDPAVRGQDPPAGGPA